MKKIFINSVEIGLINIIKIIIIMKFFNLIMLLIKQGIILMEKIRIKKMLKKIII